MHIKLLYGRERRARRASEHSFSRDPQREQKHLLSLESLRLSKAFKTTARNRLIDTYQCGDDLSFQIQYVLHSLTHSNGTKKTKKNQTLFKKPSHCVLRWLLLTRGCLA